MMRFDVEARLEKVERLIIRRETQLRPLRRERRILREMLDDGEANEEKQTPTRRRPRSLRQGREASP